jgi:FkbM family methyltransferase
MKVEMIKFRLGDQERIFYVRPHSSDEVIIRQIFTDRVLDLSNFKRSGDLENFLRVARTAGKRPLIIDGGANIGAASVYFSAQCRDAFVVAVEPEASNFQLLVENTRGLAVLPLPCGLAATPQRVRVIDVGYGFLGFRTRLVTEAGEDDVSCVTINEIFASHQEDCFPFLVKIDIEGAEKELFQQHTEWMAKTPVIIVELHDWMLPGQRVALPFLRSLCQLDRDFISMGENVLSIANHLDDLLPRGVRETIYSPAKSEKPTEAKRG